MISFYKLIKRIRSIYTQLQHKLKMTVFGSVCGCGSKRISPCFAAPKRESPSAEEISEQQLPQFVVNIHAPQ